MTPTSLRLGIGVILALLSWLQPCAGQTKSTKPDFSIEALVRQLSSDDFAKREDAKRQLFERRDARIPLEKAAKNPPDLETGRRVQLILEELVRRRAHHYVARLELLAKRGAVDQFADLFANPPPEVDKKASWKIAFELAKRILVIDKQAEDPNGDVRGLDKTEGFDKTFFDGSLPASNIITAKRIGNDTFSKIKPEIGALFVAAEEVPSIGGLMRSIVLSAGKSTVTSFQGGALISLGDVTSEVGASGSVIISDGNVTIPGSMYYCLIVARDDVTITGTVAFCRVLTQGRVIGGKVPGKLHRSIVKQNDPLPLGFIRFFDLKQCGLEVVEANGGLRVNDVDKKQPFFGAGLRPHDVISAVNSGPVADAEQLRRALRPHVAIGDPVELRIRRGQQDLDINVEFE